MSSEERLARLEDAFTLLIQMSQNMDERVDELSHRTDERMDELIAAQANAEAKIAALADAQIRTEDALQVLTQRVTELVDTQAHTDRRLDALIDIIREGRTGQA